MQKEIWTNPGLEGSGKLYGACGVLGKKSKFGLKTSKSNIYKIKSNDDIKNLPMGNPYVFVEFSDWEIIPAENLIARYNEVGKKRTKIIVKTNDFDKMKVLANTLEKGVDGFLLDSEDALKNFSEHYSPVFNVELVDAEITELVDIDMGKRACVDCVMAYAPREGALKGWLNDFMFLADAETTENQYVNTRPWRVNLGAAGEYVLTRSKGVITPRILDDLKSGDEIVAVDTSGNARIETVGRVKKENRPMTFIMASYEDKKGKKWKGTTCSQNAETVRLVTPDGSKPVPELKVGDLVKARVTEPVATHFGMPVEEGITEV